MVWILDVFFEKELTGFADQSDRGREEKKEGGRGAMSLAWEAEGGQATADRCLICAEFRREHGSPPDARGSVRLLTGGGWALGGEGQGVSR